ncbi:TonB-dependent receptor domain-containing protein [Rhizorhabdus dicambivorans]|uniref:TonB-dependent receptor n=1 Tax=Rhizorhabdus dicambivorans TaxID=1850238 RepID=A0A2A4FUM5_9SPHN|nr:TonB-dependent receptor [Rhizorhabdus dicambivorans]ATE63542.1 TonB-dependent receptor [Rhizorhabdus dicambivorans]PCE41404.1 TonB-dependent receptor [Rhizorhabdus dicambivorans]
MKTPLALGRSLLLSTALMTSAAALAQTPAAPATPPAAAEPEEEQVEVSTLGASAPSTRDIVVTGRRQQNVIRATPQVVSVLSSADIARTGDGDIAGALQRVTGLSVVGNGFVYVRGLGDRYSLALLNGSPLPSPEPLKRVVPLDLFPTSILASSLVQKSYSANYPGEFGGGVINLTTKAIPSEPFLSIGGSISGDSETTGKLGYTYYGSDYDWFGFDNGTRDIPRGLKAAVKNSSTTPIVQGATYSAADLQDFAASLNNADTSLLQRNRNIPANFSADITAGTSMDTDSGRVGVLAALGFSNSWKTRDVLQQSSIDPGLAGIPNSQFQTVITDNHVTVNGLLGLGAEVNDHKFRWTNLFIRDTVKQGRLSSGYNRSVSDPVAGQPDSLIKQNTYWFERQLIDTQGVAELRFGPLSIDLRATYANSQRESPYERGFSYFYSAQAGDYINNLASGGQSADIAFSDLNEDIYAASGDIAYKLDGALTGTISGGVAYSKTKRQSERYQFQYFRPAGALDLAVAQERPDFLVSDYNIYTYNIQLRDVSGAEGSRAYSAGLEIKAAYGQAEIELAQGLRLQGGLRYEDAEQFVTPDAGAGTQLSKSYLLPAATLTYNIQDDMQVRLAGSKTVARPQFRELARQIYQDFDSDRQFTGNPFLRDSTLYNGEARFEWYFDRNQRLSVAGFYKKLNNPIEAAAFFAGGGVLRTGFANAPEAQLYGAEIEVEKHVPLDTLGGSFFETKRLVLIGNYTFTKSKLKVDNSIVIGPDLSPVAANALFRDGAPLTGQSDHIGNIQLSFEDTERLSQLTVLFNYASERVTNRGPIQGTLSQPDIQEKPGIRLDLVGRQGFKILNTDMELKIEARNLTGTGYKEFQKAGANIVYLNRYDVGRSFSLGLTANF